MNQHFFEVFFRDGSYALDFGFTAEHLRIIGGAMEDAGFEYVEIGHGYGQGAARKGYPAAAETDEQYLKTASRVFKNTAYGVFFIPGVGTMDDIKKAFDHGIRFISIGQNITAVEQAADAVALSKTLGLLTTVCLMKAHVLAGDRFETKIKSVQAWEPDYICIMDSSGAMTPGEVKQRVESIHRLGSARAGFHGHDNLMLATANSLAAAECGAARLDVSLGGLGRSAGNTRTETMTALFQRLGHPVKPGLEGVEKALESVQRAGLSIPGATGITGLLLGLYGLHSSIADDLDEAAQRIGVPKAKLYEAVANHNPVNPTKSEIEEVALKIKG